MFEACVWLILGSLLAYTVVIDWQSGEMRLPRAGSGRPLRRVLRRRDFPLMFVTLLGVRVFAVIAFGLILTGRLLTLIQESISK